MMKNRASAIRCIVLIALCVTYLRYAFRIGFWLSGDMHSGGPLLGVLLFPLFMAVATLILYPFHGMARRISITIIAGYLIVIAVLLFILDQGP